MKVKSSVFQLIILSAIVPLLLGAANFYGTPDKTSKNKEMIVQIIKIQSPLAENELIDRAQTRAEKFRAIPGLVQKFYVRRGGEGAYAGIYIWDSKESMMAFKGTELAKTIPVAYELQGPPEIEISDMLFQLRE
ncbi:MAG: hypothetical protein R8P61_08810 [Bacteroidia bacterium]|nr:hypothetical protein [Bacteroidia bacterium]